MADLEYSFKNQDSGYQSLEKSDDSDFKLVDNVIEYSGGYKAFMQKMTECGLIDLAKQSGQVVFADDQLVNREAIRMKMEHLGIDGQMEIFGNGQETVNHFERVLNSLEYDEIDIESLNVTEHAIQPVTLLLLDINMPLLNGFQVLTQVKSMFAQVEQRLNIGSNKSTKH